MITNDPNPRPLRLWPGVALAILVALAWFVMPRIEPEWGLYGMLGAVAGGALILLWWLFFSRAAWSERLAAIGLMAVGVLAMSRIAHPSIAGAGQGMLLYVFGLPTLALALVVWAAATRRFSPAIRRGAMVAAVALGCLPWIVLRTDGVRGGAGSDFHWRWTPTPEELLLAKGEDEPKPLPPPPAPAETPKETSKPDVEKPADAGRREPAAPPAPDPARSKPAPVATRPAAPAPVEAAAEWPGFRGPNRDSVVHDVQINTDWSSAPPVELWRRPIGPGWSSFAVRGDVLYTQEQRGEEEIVAAYRVSTGEPVWRHRDRVRFWESNGGPGPRGTPTLSGGRVYAFGATGILNALDANTGTVVWSRNAATDTGRRIPQWGFASSPLVLDDMVIVGVSGTLAAFDLATGRPRWVGPPHGGSYSSPHLSTFDGVEQIVLLSTAGATSVSPSDGKLLWEHQWEGSAIVQPALTGDGGIVINTIGGTGGLGTRRLAVTQAAGQWKVEERWTSIGLKPYFNDFVVHGGHAYGFDGSILACIDLADGARKWKGGRYGNGQMVLLAEQDLLLVLSEEGELVLVSATPDKFTEVARFKAMDAKTWNHPVLVGDRLLVRNGEEMVAYRLSLAEEATTR